MHSDLEKLVRDLLDSAKHDYDTGPEIAYVPQQILDSLSIELNRMDERRQELRNLDNDLKNLLISQGIELKRETK